MTRGLAVAADKFLEKNVKVNVIVPYAWSRLNGEGARIVKVTSGWDHDVRRRAGLCAPMREGGAWSEVLRRRGGVTAARHERQADQAQALPLPQRSGVVESVGRAVHGYPAVTVVRRKLPH
jgi:hypothetical protein